MRHPAVAGVFKLRDSVIPLVDLMSFFEPGAMADKDDHVVILMEFNNYQVGFYRGFGGTDLSSWLGEDQADALC